MNNNRVWDMLGSVFLKPTKNVPADENDICRLKLKVISFFMFNVVLSFVFYTTYKVNIINALEHKIYDSANFYTLTSKCHSLVINQVDLHRACGKK